jgi:hypothetical protein
VSAPGTPNVRRLEMKRFVLSVAVAASAVLGGQVAAAPGAANPVVNSATGSGHRISGGEFRSFSFSARRYADGSSSGEAEVHPRSLDAFAHIKVDCLRVLPGRIAHMSGTVTKTSDPTVFLLGEYVHFAVQDNGEGAAAPPDKVTGIPESEPVRCDGPLPGPPKTSFSNVIRGNVQVR